MENPSNPSESKSVVSAATPATRSNRSKVILAVGAVLLVAALLYVAILHKQLSDLRTASSKVIEAHVQTIYLQAQQVQALDRLATRVDRFNRDFSASLGRLQVNDNLETNIKALEEKGHLPEDAQKSLDEFEKSIADIQAMTEKMKEFERYLGAPATVKRGDSHSQIARNYLVSEAKLTPQEADDVLKRTALAWELEPGNQVFNLYHDGILLSTVAQGTARRAPLMVQWSQRQAVTARIHELEDKLRTLEEKLAGGTAARQNADVNGATP